MDNEQNEYQSGNAALFHAAAVKKPSPLYCDICGKTTAEFKEDYDKWEIYQCSCCGTQNWIAVR